MLASAIMHAPKSQHGRARGPSCVTPKRIAPASDRHRARGQEASFGRPRRAMNVCARLMTDAVCRLASSQEASWETP
jgi:hypothetical protein